MNAPTDADEIKQHLDRLYPAWKKPHRCGCGWMIEKPRASCRAYWAAVQVGCACLQWNGLVIDTPSHIAQTLPPSWSGIVSWSFACMFAAMGAQVMLQAVRTFRSAHHAHEFYNCCIKPLVNR